MVIKTEYISKEFVLPGYSEIPGVGLFLEQVSKYINEYLTPLGEPELTGSMISNYVKKGIIDNPVKKQYGREQIAYLIYIAIAKTVLSLEDITTMIELQRETCDVESAYEYFRTRFMEILEAVFTSGAIDVSGKDTLVKALAQNMMITAAHKIYLDMTFDGLRSGNRALDEKGD
ncbi:protein of unknown function [Lachnospiraceae bacterium XBB2008]|nr:DUF1836 domain-containing protein [Lachnospiraceae bacterium]SCY68365.1 protein of unknown function [Lachnospiraceae bacterium XBB2008]